VSAGNFYCQIALPEINIFFQPCRPIKLRDWLSNQTMYWLHDCTDDRLYQMNHCVSIPMIFVSAIFASLSRTAKMALTAKMRDCYLLDCSRFMAWIHLLPKWRPTRAHKKSRTQFWLSDSSGIIYHLWWLWENILIKNKHETFNCCVYCTALNFSSLLQVAPFHYKISEILLAVFNHQRSSIAEARNTEAGFTL
jgi:hypothetical protein